MVERPDSCWSLPGVPAFLKPEPWARQSPVSGSARLEAWARLGSACGLGRPEHHCSHVTSPGQYDRLTVASSVNLRTSVETRIGDKRALENMWLLHCGIDTVTNSARCSIEGNICAVIQSSCVLRSPTWVTALRSTEHSHITIYIIPPCLFAELGPASSLSSAYLLCSCNAAAFTRSFLASRTPPHIQETVPPNTTTDTRQLGALIHALRCTGLGGIHAKGREKGRARSESNVIQAYSSPVRYTIYSGAVQLHIF
ncbi:hypothetical protein DFH09DRAFT_1288438 [Mycena vulgaris]|nr:hypothetical protein DFH09DRAFT_1288438 [Mycena vulgaris]